jgi:amidase
MAALENLATQLSRAGAHVREIQPESFADLRDYYKLYLAIFWTINSTGMPAEARHHEATQYRATGDEFLAAYANGLTASAADYIIWHGQREQYRAAYRAFFREWDVLLAPANIVNAFPHIDVPMPTRTLDVNGQAVAYDLQCVYPALANLTGQPATAFPVGLTRAGLPIGLQAIGPYLEDRTPMRFTTLVAQEYGGFRPPPGYETD